MPSRAIRNSPAELPVPDWVKQATRRFMVGFHVWDYDQLPAYRRAEKKDGVAPILSRFDADAFVRALRRAEVQWFWFYNKCHQGNSYHPSAVPGAHVHSAMRGRDFFGELVAACEREGIVPACVYEFSDHRVMRFKPEWCHRVPSSGAGDMTDAIQGSRVGGGCLNGPYGDYAIAQVCETAERYPIRALYIDFLGFFGHENWRCPHGCNEKLNEALGAEFRGIRHLTHKQYVAYLQWKFEQYDAYTRRMKAALQAVRPGLVFVHNAHLVTDGPNLQTYELAGRHCDYVTGDLFTMRAGTLQMSWILRTYANTSRYRPSEALLDSLVAIGGDMATPKALDSYRAELWTARAVDVTNCCSISMNIDGSFDHENIELVRQVYREQKACEPWLRDMEFEAAVGIVRSQNTILYRPPEDQSKVLVPKIHTPQHALEFQGWVQTLVAAHQLWDVVQDYQLTDEMLRRFKVLILPNVGCLSRDQCAAIEAFVQRGGVLLASGETAQFDELGRRRKRRLLAELFGIKQGGERVVRGERIQLTHRAVKPNASWVAPYTFHFSGVWPVRAAEDCTVLGDVYSRVGEGAIINAFVPAGRPGILRRRAGRGTVYYCAGLHGLEYRLWGVATQKRLMSRLLDLAVGSKAPVACEAPATVELFAHRQSGRTHWVVNLVNNVSGVSRNTGRLGIAAGEIQNEGFRFDECEAMPPAYGVRLRFLPSRGQRIRRVYLAPDRKPLRLKRLGRGVEVEVPPFTVHAMVVAEEAP